jgi:uncharacterized protein Veg
MYRKSICTEAGHSTSVPAKMASTYGQRNAHVAQGARVMFNNGRTLEVEREMEFIKTTLAHFVFSAVSSKSNAI